MMEGGRGCNRWEEQPLTTSLATTTSPDNHHASGDLDVPHCRNDNFTSRGANSTAVILHGMMMVRRSLKPKE